MQPCKFEDRIIAMSEDIAEVKTDVKYIKDGISLSGKWKLAIVVALLGMFGTFLISAKSYGKLEQKVENIEYSIRNTSR